MIEKQANQNNEEDGEKKLFDLDMDSDNLNELMVAWRIRQDNIKRFKM